MQEMWGFSPWVGKIPWRRAWQPTPVFLPGESHGQRSLVGYSPRFTKSQTRLKQQYEIQYDLIFLFILLEYSWELDHKEDREPKNWCLKTVVLEKTPKIPLDSKEIKIVNLKGNQSWIITGRTDAEAEAPVFWSSDVNRQLIGKVPDVGKDRGQEEKKASVDEMAGWHHQCNEHELGRTPGDAKRQGGLACHSPWSPWSWARLDHWAIATT